MTWQQFYALPAAKQPIDVKNPDYALLDEAFFHATNEARTKEKKEPLAYSSILHRSSAGHSTAMVDKNFYGHEDRTDPKRFYFHQRIAAAGGNFKASAENIAQYEVIETKKQYCPRKQSNGEYRYFNCETDQIFPTYTYITYAQRVVDGWMKSPGHRRNILSPYFQYMGCAARIGKNPFRDRSAPFARSTQHFGGTAPKITSETAAK